METRPQLPLLATALLPLLLLSQQPRPAAAALVKRYADAQCTALVGSYKIFGKRCYGNSKQNGNSALDWAPTIGTAPIVASWAVQACVPGQLTIARYDTPTGATDFCAGSATSTVQLTTNLCVPDALGAENIGGAFSMLVDDTCLTDSVANPFLIANMFYGGSCDVPQYVFRATYSVNSPGDCEVVQIPQFLESTTVVRATFSYSTLFGGGYKLTWFDVNDASCRPSTIKQAFTNLVIGSCSSIYNGQGSVQLYQPTVEFPTAVTLGTPSPSPSPTPPALVRSGVLSGASGSSGDSAGGGAGLAGLAALVVLPIGAAAWWYFNRDKMRSAPRRGKAPSAQPAAERIESTNPIRSAV
jgi:hypothetical protein